MNTSSLLSSLSRRWLRRQLVRSTVITLAIGLLPLTLVALLTLTTKLLSIPLAIAIGCGGIVAPMVWLLLAKARVLRRQEIARQGQIARHLDRIVPDLEESAELLLHPEAELPPLARLQRRRTQRVLKNLDPATLPRSLPSARLRRSAILLVASLTLSGALLALLPGWLAHLGAPAADHLPVAAGAGAESLPRPLQRPTLEQIEVRIAPPSYTGRPVRRVQGLDVEAEEGSMLTWEVEVAGSATGASLLFADRRQPLVHDDSAAPTRFRGSLRLNSSQVYQIILEDEAGEVLRTSFARLVVLPDRPPQVRIVRPRPTIEVAADHPGEVVIEAEVSDDYGVAGAMLIATLATGTGERVEFREQEFAFDSSTPLLPAGAIGARFSRRLDLSQLKLEAGSELFYFVEITDNRRPEAQRARSATQRIRLPGGRGASIALGRGLALRGVPEFFRSQRQIIIDTEKLLAERSRLSREELRYRAESIGFDQAALRHRYGNMLGLESQNGSPLGRVDNAAGPGADEHRDDHDEEHAAPPTEADDGPNLSGRLIELAPEEFTHQHDSGEISTFFTDAVRSKLRACLAAMWESERRLRTVQPRAALPHENEALTLLKEVQQAARVYVQRVGFAPAPLDPAGKRLTGELDKIRSRRLRLTGDGSQPPSEIELALHLLAQFDRGLDPAQRQRLVGLLDSAGRELARRSLDDPLTEIGALDDLRQLIERLRTENSGLGGPLPPVAKVEAALWRLLAQPQPRPVRRRPSGVGELWSVYRDRLAEGG